MANPKLVHVYFLFSVHCLLLEDFTGLHEYLNLELIEVGEEFEIIDIAYLDLLEPLLLLLLLLFYLLFFETGARQLFLSSHVIDNLYVDVLYQLTRLLFEQGQHHVFIDLVQKTFDEEVVTHEVIIGLSFQIESHLLSCLVK